MQPRPPRRRRPSATRPSRGTERRGCPGSPGLLEVPANQAASGPMGVGEGAHGWAVSPSGPTSSPTGRWTTAPGRPCGAPLTPSLVLQRQLWRCLSAGSVVSAAGLGLASSPPPGPVGGGVEVGSRSADEGVEQPSQFGHGQRDELAGSGCGPPLSVEGPPDKRVRLLVL